MNQNTCIVLYKRASIVGVSLLALITYVCFAPSLYARDMQADTQCPSGGVVGQTCTDSTNGFVTQGHCTYVGICKADSWNKNPPKGCGSGGTTGDCPKAPPISGGTPRSVTGQSGSLSGTTSVSPDSDITGAGIQDAFSTSSNDGTASTHVGINVPPTADIVASIAGIADPVSFFEGQQVGAPLVSAPAGYRLPVYTNTDIRSLSPTQGDAREVPSAGTYDALHAARVSVPFTLSTGTPETSESLQKNVLSFLHIEIVDPFLLKGVIALILFLIVSGIIYTIRV